MDIFFQFMFFKSNIPDDSDEVFRSLPEDSDLDLPLVATVSW